MVCRHVKTKVTYRRAHANITLSKAAQCSSITHDAYIMATTAAFSLMIQHALIYLPTSIDAGWQEDSVLSLGIAADFGVDPDQVAD